MTPEEEQRLEHNLTNHRPVDPAVISRMEWLRGQAKDFGKAILVACPDSRERAVALTNLEQTVMWAIAALARNQP